MNLLPYARVSIQTTTPLSAVIAALEAHIEAPRVRWGFSRDHAPYTGTLTESGFEIHRIIHYRNSFLPRIRGQFEALPQGTIVHVTLSLHPLVLAFLLFWLCTWYGILLPVAVIGMLAGDVPPEIVPFIGLPLLALVAFWGAFWYEAKRSQRDLAQIVHGNPLVVPPTHRLRLRLLQLLALAIGGANLVWFLSQPTFLMPGESTQPPPVQTCAQASTASPYCDFALARTIEGHPTATAIALSPDGKILLTGGQDKAIRVWDWQQGSLTRTLQSDSGIVTALAMSSDNKTVVSAAADRMVRIWDLTTQQPPKLLQGQMEIGVDMVKLSADGKTIVSGGYGKIAVWDRATGTLKVTLPAVDKEIQTLGPITIENSFRLYPFSLSPDGTTALVELNGKLLAWNTVTQTQTELPRQVFTQVNAAYLSPDGQTVVTTSYTQPKTHLKIWDLATGDLKAKVLLSTNRELWGYRDRIALSRDRIFISTPSGIQVRHLQTGELEALVEQPSLYQIIVTPDGKRLVGMLGDASSQTAKIQIWQRP